MEQYLAGRNIGSIANRLGVTTDKVRKVVESRGYIIAGADCDSYGRQHVQNVSNSFRKDALKPDEVCRLMNSWGAREAKE